MFYSHIDFDLIEKFSPIYHFDSQEEYFPIDLNSFNNGRLNKNIVNVYLRELKEISNDLIWIYYICFYTFDSGIKVCTPFNCFSKNKVSSHEFDFEIVILEINKKSEKICRVCFCPHGLDENFWIAENDLELILDKNNSDKIHIFVSRGKHASYPVKGIIWRHFGFANDYNNDDRILLLKPIILTSNTINSQIFETKKKCLSFDYNTIPVIPYHSVKKRKFFG